jgi:hypothetical protein
MLAVQSELLVLPGLVLKKKAEKQGWAELTQAWYINDFEACMSSSCCIA